MRMAVLCTLKSVDFKKRVEVSFSTFKAGWEGTVEWAPTASQAQHPAAPSRPDRRSATP
jgi:hypothetical protein